MSNQRPTKFERYTEKATTDAGRRLAQLRDATGEAHALRVILASWREGSVRLPGRHQNAGDLLKKRMKIVVEDYLEEVLEEIDALAAGRG